MLCEHCWPAVNHSNDGKPPAGLKLLRTVKEEFALNPSWDLFCLSLALFPWRAESTRFLLTASFCSLVPHGPEVEGQLFHGGNSEQTALFTCGTKNTW